MGNLQVGGAIGTAFRLVFRNLGAYLPTQGVLVVAAALPTLAMTLAAPVLGPLGSDDVQAEALAAAYGENPSALVAGIAAALVSGALSFAFLMLGLGLGAIVTDDLLRGERPSASGAWGRLARRGGNLLLTGLCLVALVLLGLVVVGAAFFLLAMVHPALALLGVLGVFGLLVALVVFFVRWFVVFPVGALESRSVTGNLARAAELSKGQRGAIFGLVALLVLIGIAAGLLVAVPLAGAAYVAAGSQAMAGEDPAAMMLPTWLVVAHWVGETLAQLATGFLGAAVATVAYRQLDAPARPHEWLPRPPDAGAPPAPQAPAPPGAVEPVTYVNLAAERERVLGTVEAARRHAGDVAARAPGDAAMQAWSRHVDAWLQTQEARARQAADATELRRIGQEIEAHVLSAR